MQSTIRKSPIRFVFCLWLAVLFASSLPCTAVAAGNDGLRDRFPASSIGTTEKADAALAATSGAKLRVEIKYKAAARECMKKFMVSDCIEEARTLRHDGLAEIDAVQVEANRFKRRDKADRIEAERAQRESDRAANAQADAELRTKNRQNYDGRQEQAKREAADRARSDATRAGHSPAVHRPLIKGAKPGTPEAAAAQRAKNASGQAAKIRDAAAHREQLAHRHAENEADRARRAKQQAQKEAERKAAQNAAGATATVKP